MVEEAYKVLRLIEQRENEVIDVKKRNEWLATNEATEIFIALMKEYPNGYKDKWSELLESKFKR